jgi:hypothetical protein
MVDQFNKNGINSKNTMDPIDDLLRCVIPKSECDDEAIGTVDFSDYFS